MIYVKLIHKRSSDVLYKI